MYASVRRYAGNADLADKLAARKDEVVPLISAVAGLRGYYLIRAGDDTVSVTVCDDEAGAQESNAVAAGWLRENMPEVASSPPEISAGEVVITT
jgi:hypothetical protein